jgi:hypothetical protein
MEKKTGKEECDADNEDASSQRACVFVGQKRCCVVESVAVVDTSGAKELPILSSAVVYYSPTLLTPSCPE